MYAAEKNMHFSFQLWLASENTVFLNIHTNLDRKWRMLSSREQMTIKWSFLIVLFPRIFYISLIWNKWKIQINVKIQILWGRMYYLVFFAVNVALLFPEVYGYSKSNEMANFFCLRTKHCGIGAVLTWVLCILCEGHYVENMAFLAPAGQSRFLLLHLAGNLMKHFQKSLPLFAF